MRLIVDLSNCERPDLSAKTITVLLILFFAGSTLAKPKNDTDRNDTDVDLGKKTAELKKQALKLLELRGVNVTQNISAIKPVARWDDIQMTEDLYNDIKSSFDEEQKLLESTKDASDRTTAPDFKLIPFAKWTMPIKYTTYLINSNGLKKKIRMALEEIQTKSGCIKFTEVSSKPSGSHLSFKERDDMGEGVCADSPLGRQQNGNTINVATDCQNYGSMIHETLHSLGFAHSQQRPDVDQYITIQWQNMIPDADIQSNFKPWKYALKNQGPFDYGSIMMYPTVAFSANGRETLVPKRDPAKNRLLMGQRDHLSSEDVNILKKIYCSDSGSSGGTSGGGTSGGGTSGGGTSGGKTSGGTSTSNKNNSNCKDRSRSCDYWQSRGYCKKSSIFFYFVSDLCEKTCDLC